MVELFSVPGQVNAVIFVVQEGVMCITASLLHNLLSHLHHLTRIVRFAVKEVHLLHGVNNPRQATCTKRHSSADEMAAKPTVAAKSQTTVFECSAQPFSPCLAN